MKSLKSILEASILSDIDDQLEAGDEAIKQQIKKFINDNYYTYENLTISDEPNKDGKYEVSIDGDVSTKNKECISLTNGLFIWKTVEGDFFCNKCKSLKSLEGAPKEVGCNFYCNDCKSLKSLKGAPEKVGGSFYCNMCRGLKSLEGAPKELDKHFYCTSCTSLTSLEGAPKEVDGNFNCAYCNSLTSLEGAPEEVKGDFSCICCKKLTSLKGTPKEVGGDFDCFNCGANFAAFTKDDVMKASNVKGKINC